MVEIKYSGDQLWARIERAVDKVKDRFRRVTKTLNEAEVSYAVIGGNAVQLWVAQVDESSFATHVTSTSSSTKATWIELLKRWKKWGSSIVTRPAFQCF